MDGYNIMSLPPASHLPLQILSRAATVRYEEGKGEAAALEDGEAEAGDGSAAAAGAEGGAAAAAGGLQRHTSKGGLNLSKATFAVEEGDLSLDMKVSSVWRGRPEPRHEGQ